MNTKNKLSLGNDHLKGQIYSGQPKSRFSGSARLQRRVTFSLRLPTLLTLGIGSLVLMAWMFFLGVLLGRGYMPEDDIPQLENILPRTAETEPARIVDVGAQTPGAATQVERPLASAGGVQQQGQGNLPAGISSLGQEPVARATTPTAAQNVQTRPTQQTATQNTSDRRTGTPGGTAGTNRADNRPQARNESATAQSQTNTGQSKSANEVFDYVFQIAAYKDKQSAENFAAKLKKDKFSPQIIPFKDAAGTPWYRINLPLRGTAEDVVNLQEKMKKYGINKIIRQSKKPVSS